MSERYKKKKKKPKSDKRYLTNLSNWRRFYWTLLLPIIKKKDDCRRLGLVKQTNIPSSNSQVHLPDFLSDKLE